MVQISITIDNDNEVTISQSATPTKVEKKNISADKIYFIVMHYYNDGFSGGKAYPELITEDYSEACFLKEELEKYISCYDKVRILMQKNGSFIPCNGVNSDMDIL